MSGSAPWRQPRGGLTITAVEARTATRPVESFGEIATFAARVTGMVVSGRVLRFFGEVLRQAGILIVSSTLVIWGLVFITGL